MNIFLYNRYRKIYKTDDGLLYVIHKKNKINISKYFTKKGVVKKEHKHLIQQNSKKVGGAGNALVVCSFNVNTWNGYNINRDIFIKMFKTLISNKNVDLLLTQEDQHYNTYDTSESVKAYSLNAKDSKSFSFISCINTSLQFGKAVVPRNAIIIKDTEFGITIANLHLQGGRYLDLELGGNTFQIYLEIKLELLRKVLESKPDIILGDFNSVFCKDPNLLQKMYDDQQKYYESIYSTQKQDTPSDVDETNGSLVGEEKGIRDNLGIYLIKKCPYDSGVTNKVSLSKDKVVSWNNEPFRLLQKAGYEYIEPTNIKTPERKINPTNSRGENVIDHVWVKKSIRKKYTFSTEIYDGFGEEIENLYGGISDHKPVILTIQSKIEVAKQMEVAVSSKRQRTNTKKE